MSLFRAVCFVGFPNTFPPPMLELLASLTVTEIASFIFLVFPVIWSLTYVLFSSSSRVLCGVCCWDEDIMKGMVVAVVIATGVKARIKLIVLKGVSIRGQKVCCFSCMVIYIRLQCCNMKTWMCCWLSQVRPLPLSISGNTLYKVEKDRLESNTRGGTLILLSDA